VVEIADGLLGRLPLVKLVYTSIKDLVSAVRRRQEALRRPGRGDALTERARVLGFVTRDGLARLGMPDHVAVYFPQSYNFAGYLLLVPRTAVEPLPLPPRR
jgi:uncharacterized membrane protein